MWLSYQVLWSHSLKKKKKQSTVLSFGFNVSVAILLQCPNAIPNVPLASVYCAQSKSSVQPGESMVKKMAFTGEKVLSGMDVAFYQELCGSRLKLRIPQTDRRDTPKETGGKRSMSGRGNICWVYNDGMCKHTPCKFPHVCDICQGNHPKQFCLRHGKIDNTMGMFR